MNLNEFLSEIKSSDPIACQLAEEIEGILTAYTNGELSAEEKNYLLEEIRDIKAANQMAQNEIAVRYIAQACNVAISLA